MSTDFLMGIGVGIMLAAIGAGYGICLVVEAWKKRRRQLRRVVIAMRRVPSPRRERVARSAR